MINKPQIEMAIEAIIDYCRKEELLFRQGYTNISGVKHLHNLLQNGTVTMKTYINILPAIAYPEAKYELTINYK